MGAKWAKAISEILTKCGVVTAALSNEKSNFGTPSKLIIPCAKSHELYSVA